jgi:hypothetical protein
MTGPPFDDGGVLVSGDAGEATKIDPNRSLRPE